MLAFGSKYLAVKKKKADADRLTIAMKRKKPNGGI